MSNGCICSTLREDLLEQVAHLAQQGRFDCFVIESAGISEPLPAAEASTFANQNGISPSDVAEFDTMVTVVDAVNFLKDYDHTKSLRESGESLGEDDERRVADLMVDQVEFADMILISKSDLAGLGSDLSLATKGMV
jgi:G3E family GTPase